MSASTLLLVGGTFDPPHIAHADMAQAARHWIGPRTHLVFIPAARSPFKPPPVASDTDRIAMLKAMADSVPPAEVWTDEIDRARPGQPSYWVDTLSRAHERLSAHLRASASSLPHRTLDADAPAWNVPELCFLIGADQAIALHRWRDPRRILELARPVIVAREPVVTPAILARALRDARFWSPGEIDFLTSRLVPCPLSDVSATAIRRGLSSADAGVEACLHPAVLTVIRERRLYTA